MCQSTHITKLNDARYNISMSNTNDIITRVFNGIFKRDKTLLTGDFSDERGFCQYEIIREEGDIIGFMTCNKDNDFQMDDWEVKQLLQEQRQETFRTIGYPMIGLLIFVGFILYFGWRIS